MGHRLPYTSQHKVQIFWEGHKNLAHLPLFIWHYLVASNYKWKMGQIFVAFLEYLNFSNLLAIIRVNVFVKIWGSPPAPRYQRPYTALQKQKKRTRLMGYHLFPRKSSNGTRVRVGIIQLSCKLDVNCYHALIREEKFQCLKVNNFQKISFVCYVTYIQEFQLLLNCSIQFWTKGNF